MTRRNGSALVLGTLAAAWAGLQIKPPAFTAYPEPTPALDWVDLPAGLPEPVARFYDVICGGRVPVITSAVITGRATLRFGPIRLPGRFRFILSAGQAYRHYIEATWFGLPVLRVNEYYLDGKARMELPFGTVANEPKTDMAANIGLWAESLWFPSLYVTDPRVRWEPVDRVTARLIVPVEEGEGSFTTTFDPDSGLLRRLETLRYKGAKDEAKTLWRNEATSWRRYHGMLIPATGSVTWMDEGTPWFVFDLDEVVYNTDVSAAIRATGA